MTEKQEQKKVKGKEHSEVGTRGQTFVGKVVSAKMNKTVVVEWHYLHFVPKYEQYERRKTRVSVHNPTHIHARLGDMVTIKECRPISKTKHFIINNKKSGGATK